jgi:hypothetical protein
MPNFKIIFERFEKRVYNAFVDADDEYEAKELFNDSPFNYTDDDGEIEEHYQVEFRKITEITEND